MKIEITASFVRQLSRQVAYISFDKPSAARRFKADVFSEIKQLKDFPLKCRKSIYFEDEQRRDLVFKGYVITYVVEKEKVIVFALTKYTDFKR